MDLNQISQRAKRVNQSLIEKLLKEEILKNKEEILDIIKNRWEHGEVHEDSDSLFKPLIGIYESEKYRQEKLILNPKAGGNVDLILTGDLKGGLTIFPLRGGNFSIFSKDDKALMIADKYGIDVYGLSIKEEEMVLEVAFAEINIKLMNFIQLGISL